MADTSEQTSLNSETNGNDVFDSSECLDYCERVVTNERVIWKCAICLLSNFKYQTQLENHITSIHLLKKACTWCHMQFDDLDLVIDHCQSESCKAGDFKKLNSRYLLEAEKHLQENAINNNRLPSTISSSDVVGIPVLKQAHEHICTSCGQKFFTKAHLNFHHFYQSNCVFQQKESKKDPEAISKCYSLVYDSTGSVKWRMFKCLKCNTLHPNQFAVKRHIQRQHFHLKKFTCNICKKGFFDIVTWKKHTNNPIRCRAIKIALQVAVQQDEVRHESDIEQNHTDNCKEQSKQGPMQNSDKKDENVTNNKVIEKYANNVRSDKTVLKNTATDTDSSSFNGDNATNDKKMFKCRICSQIVCGLEYYIQHLKIDLAKHTTNLFKCDLCNKKYTDKNSLHYHVNSVHRKRKFVCLQCHAVFSDRYLLRKHKKLLGHVNRRTRNKKIVCSKARDGVKAKTYSCSVCSLTFSKYKEKVAHVRLQHPVDVPVMCNICEKQFNNTKRLLDHKRAAHAVQTSEYHCQMCSFKTCNKYSFRQHFYKHSAGKQQALKCETCGESFTNPTSLTRHQKIHSDQKKFVCHVCGKSFVQKCTLSRHVDSHSQLKRYKCAVCDQRYTQSYPLAKHVKVCHPNVFEQFQQDRKTSRWRNDIPEEEQQLKKVCKPTEADNLKHITIVQVPGSDTHSSSETAANKYVCVLMNTSGSISRPPNKQLMGSVLKALDIDPAPAVVDRPKPEAKKRVRRQRHPAILSTSSSAAVVTRPAMPAAGVLESLVSPPSPVVVEQKPLPLPHDISGMDINFASGSVELPPASSSKDQSMPVASLPLDASVLSADSLDLDASLGMQDTLDQQLNMSLPTNQDDNWLDLFHNPLESNAPSSLLNASCFSSLIPFTLDADLHSGLVEPAAPDPGASQQQQQQQQQSDMAVVCDQLSRDVMAAGNSGSGNTGMQLPTLGDIPMWAGDQMLLVQDGGDSYLIAANNLAQIATGMSQDVTTLSEPKNDSELMPMTVDASMLL